MRRLFFVVVGGALAAAALIGQTPAPTPTPRIFDPEAPAGTGARDGHRRRVHARRRGRSHHLAASDADASQRPRLRGRRAHPPGRRCRVRQLRDRRWSTRRASWGTHTPDRATSRSSPSRRPRGTSSAWDSTSSRAPTTTPWTGESRACARPRASWTKPGSFTPASERTAARRGPRATSKRRRAASVSSRWRRRSARMRRRWRRAAALPDGRDFHRCGSRGASC